MEKLRRHTTFGWGYFPIICLMSVHLFGCSHTVQTTTSSSPTPSPYRIVNNTIDQDSHLMLGFTIVEKESGDSVFLHFKQLNPGRIIEDDGPGILNKGDLRLEFVSGEGEVLKKIGISDPTRRFIETFSESGDLETTEQKETRAEFYVRVNTLQGMQTARIYRLQDSGSEKFIQAIPVVFQ